MKMRVLYSTNKGKIKTIAQLITDKYATEKVNCMDSIPPAYSCDKDAWSLCSSRPARIPRTR